MERGPCRQRLTGGSNLFAEQLAATNLHGATLPDSLTRFEPLETSAKLADNASKVFLTMLSAVAFTLLTLATTTETAAKARPFTVRRRLRRAGQDRQNAAGGSGPHRRPLLPPLCPGLFDFPEGVVFGDPGVDVDHGHELPLGMLLASHARF